jgi:hypothetical protein
LDFGVHSVYSAGYDLNYKDSALMFTPESNEFWFQVDNVTLHRVHETGGVGLITMLMFIKDVEQNATFQVVAAIHDTRAENSPFFQPHIFHDGLSPVVSAPIQENNKYYTSPLQFGFHVSSSGQIPWNNRRYRIQIDRGRFIQMLKDINNYCNSNQTEPVCNKRLPIPDIGNPDDSIWNRYRMSGVGLLHEIFTDTVQQNISMGINASGIGVYRYQSN